MNLSGSYKALRDNSRAAMMAAIEIYNKPRFSYRSECFAILLVNAWELAFKALLSKRSRSVFYPKERDKPYKTLSITDAMAAGRPFFPAKIPFDAIRANLNLLITYRNNSVHFYNQKGFEMLLYDLSQTCIRNYRDFLYESFDIDLAQDIDITLLPLLLGTPPDPLTYISRAGSNPKTSKAMAAFLRELVSAVKGLEATGIDTARLLTSFRIK
ncbi:MAG: DUF3644 domain-containing protein, partial [bacterium]|nr:DUF3644 domain-containing protein [bacterium]